MKLVKKIRDKLNEYGINIFNDYQTEQNEHIFLCEDMILFVKENQISISFQATSRPEEVGSKVLVINEIDAKIDIMDSFVFISKNKMLVGEEAFEAVEKMNKNKALKEFNQNLVYGSILENASCYTC